MADLSNPEDAQEVGGNQVDTLGAELATLIEEHTYYCSMQYQPPRVSLEFQSEMMQSLTHFGMWLQTVKLVK